MKMKKFLCFVLCLILLISAFSVLSFAKKGKRQTPEKQKDIAIVFDNSGSMFFKWPNKVVGPSDRWSRALYATGVFASMLNYDSGDCLSIYPMASVTIGEKGNDKYNDEKPVVIASKDDVEKIHQIYTEKTNGTTLCPAKKALDKLKSNNNPNTEKVLIILTDGVFGRGLEDTDYQKDKKAETQKDLNKLSADCKKENIDIYFLGFGNDLKEGEKFSDKEINNIDISYVDDDANKLTDKLVEICNTIFQRNSVPGGVSDGHFSTDISTSLVVFAPDGEINGLSNVKPDEGSPINIIHGDTGGTSNVNADGNRDPKGFSPTKATGLKAQVATYSNCSPGDYTITSTSKKLQVYYEPDINVRTTLTSKKTGEVFTEEEALEKAKAGEKLNIPLPEEYTIDVTLVDGQTGKEIKESKLLGSNQKYEIDVKDSGGKNGNQPKPGDTVELTNECQGIDVTFYYELQGGQYSVTNDDSPFGSLQFPDFVDTTPVPDAKLEVTLECHQNQPPNPSNWYQLSKRDGWTPVVAKLTLDGQPLTAEQMKNVTVEECTIDGGHSDLLSYQPEDSSFNIFIGQDKDGNLLELEEMKDVLLKFAVRYKDPENKYSEEGSPAEDTKIIVISKNSAIFRYIVGGSIAAGAIFLLFFFLSRKVLPRKLIKSTMVFTISGKQINGNHKVKYNRRGKSLTVESIMPPDPESQCKISFSLYPVSRRWTPSRRRKVGIKGISGPSMGVKSVKLNGLSYTKDLKSGKFLAPGASPDDPIRDESNGEQIVINAKKSSLNCILDCR